MNPFLTMSRSLAEFIGECALITWDSGKRVWRRPVEVQETLNQMAFVGVASVPIVLLTGFFSGAVISLYLSSFLQQYGATQFLGATVGLTVIREIGPVIAGIMVSARCGSAMAAQIGTMAVTEQIDALTTLSTNPFKYLVVPRLLAATITLPLLVAVADIIGVMGGFLVATERLNFNPSVYMRTTMNFMTTEDVVSGLAKSAVFGFIIALMGCFHGYHSKGGAQGVGAATTSAVVSASIMILAANYILTEVFFSR
jgi:phospholipid/cholesterol/gamma-HCH transport system permease protein